MPSLVSLAAAFLAASSLAPTALAKKNVVILHSEDVMSKPYAAIASNSMMLGRREMADMALNSTGNTDVKLNPDGSINIESWNAVTDAACITALKKLPRSSNPSGHCVCYNLPSLNMDNGEFEADLRLYRVSEPRDSFATIRPEDVKIEVKFAGAAADRISQEAVKSLAAKGQAMKGHQSSISKRAFGDPELIKQSNLLGKINADRMRPDLTM